MKRDLHPELLDRLPPEDLRAMRSRRDLRLLNAIMGHAALMSAFLRSFPRVAPFSLVEIGAGDGRLLLSVARRLGPAWRGTRLVLLDLHSVATQETRDQFAALDWSVQFVTADGFDWLPKALPAHRCVVLANLVLHHFTDTELTKLFATIARDAQGMAALEPRRSAGAYLAACCVGLIGCNHVTRHDARISVRAGFSGGELSALWRQAGWDVEERRLGWFSHGFTATRTEAAG